MTSIPDHKPTFHAGEVAVQQRLGVDDKMAHIGAQVIRDHMPQQHRDFFAQLPLVVLGALDADGQPWASILSNPPGFISTPDEVTMQINAGTLAQDPLHEALVPGAAIGLLGIELHTRRRNRMNGVIEQAGPKPHGLTVKVSQSFGNCPKYIQARTPSFVQPDTKVTTMARTASALDATTRSIIERADTFFIASAHPMAHVGATASQGVDVSHRGGKPGFVRVDDDTHLTAPDYIGNFFFNTLGNLTLNPRAGLLFIDFDNGDLLYLAVTTEIAWDAHVTAEFTGAERLLRFKLQTLTYLPAALPLRWGPSALSPYLARMADQEG
ncbi:MAG: pyridoxamine 5'-phosphate oxidase family protein [Pseudomonadota bacterium]